MYRFEPAGPLGNPHSTTEDQHVGLSLQSESCLSLTQPQYKGYLIPKGSTIIMNACTATILVQLPCSFANANPQGGSHTILVSYAATMLHNLNHISSEFYEDPQDFRPERYIKHPLGLKEGSDTTGYRLSLPFGHGKVS
jgi:hypothetical protein